MVLIIGPKYSGENVMDKQLVLGEELRVAAIKNPNKEAIIYGDRRITFSALDKRTNRLANALIKCNFKKEDRAAILLHNCSEVLEIYFGLAKAGIVAVPLTYRAMDKDLGYMLDHSGVKILFCGEEFEQIIKRVRPNLTHIEKIVIIGDKDIGETENYETFLTLGDENKSEIDVYETDPLWITYTAGTTGLPKGCLSCHRGWVLQMYLVATDYGLKETDVHLTTGPLYHVAPFWSALQTICLCGTVVVMREFDPLGALKLIEKEKISQLFMVPTMLNLILNLPGDEKKSIDTSSLRVLSVGAAPLLTKTKEEILKYFKHVNIFEFYAASELGMITTLRPEDQMRKIRCCGKPFIGVEIKLFDDDGKEVAPGEVGELYMHGYNLFKEYLKDPEATAGSRRGKWITVGDMARIDEEGYYYIVDRKKDLVISGGVNIYPIEIDEVIQKHPKVLEVAVIGIPNEVWGESLKAVVVLKKGVEASEKEIIDYCKEKLPKYKVPQSCEFMTELPKSPVGKILKKVLREKYWKNQEAMV